MHPIPHIILLCTVVRVALVQEHYPIHVCRLTVVHAGLLSRDQAMLRTCSVGEFWMRKVCGIVSNRTNFQWCEKFNGEAQPVPIIYGDHIGQVERTTNPVYCTWRTQATWEMDIWQ